MTGEEESLQENRVYNRRGEMIKGKDVTIKDATELTMSEDVQRLERDNSEISWVQVRLHSVEATHMKAYL